jgi:hypothetical protein
MFRRIVASRVEFQRIPDRTFSIDLKRTPATAKWVDEGLRQAERTVQATWSGGGIDPTYPFLYMHRDNREEGAVTSVLPMEWSIASLVDYATTVGAYLGVFENLKLGQQWKDRERYGFSSAAAAGWGCLFIGDRGHEQLVSRRWLTHGPWLLHRFPGDVSFIQFHDLDADPETALAQASPGHRRLSDHQLGGYIRSMYTPEHEIKGLYVPDDQTLRIVCAPGREVGQSEMLDTCAERLVGRYDQQKPIRAVRYIFIDPADAQRHLHEMWLRELEVWTFTPDGREIRIDEDYDPPVTPPVWAATASAHEQ